MLYAPVQQEDLETGDRKGPSTPKRYSEGPSEGSWLQRHLGVGKRIGLACLILLPYVVLIGVAIHKSVPAGDQVVSVCAAQRQQQLQTPRNVYFDSSLLSRPQRFAALQQKGATLWFTGLSGSGKSTIGRALEAELLRRRVHVYRLDGDNVRTGLNRDLGFSADDRSESVRRVGEMAALFADSGVITLVGLVSPYREHRDAVRKLHQDMGVPFYEVFVDVPLKVAADRDVKGLYKRAFAGQIKDFTGVSAPYEAPLHAEVHIETEEMTLQEEVTALLRFIEREGLLTGVEDPPSGYPGVAIADGGNAERNISSLYPDAPQSRMTERPANMDALPQVLLRDEDVQWVQVLGEGWAAPLRGFMREGVYLQSLHFSSVLMDADNLSCGRLDLTSQTNFSTYAHDGVAHGTRVNLAVPIVLPINTATKKRIGDAKQVVLVSPAGESLAILRNPEVYAHRKEERITRTFGMIDLHHPYVEEIRKSGNWLLGGEIELLQRVRYNDNLDQWRLTPAELRKRFVDMKADVVVAFQTRNPTHAGHAYLMNAARQKLLDQGYKNPVLWLSPLGGWTKDDDVPLDVRVKQHEAILQAGMLDKNSTVLSIWPSPMIYAGPREVQWHAKSRRNAGASVFVVGRDPAGIKRSDHDKDDLYHGDHGRFLLHRAPDMEDFNLLSFSKVSYDVTDQKMKPIDPARKKDFVSISGSRMRAMAREGLPICTEKRLPESWEDKPTCVPRGFMAQAGWNIVVDYYQHISSPRWIPYSQQLAKAPIDSTRKFQQNGTYGHPDYSLSFLNEEGKPLSPWHDIALWPAEQAHDDGTHVTMVIEIPKGTAHKMEVQTETAWNPIQQDTTHNGTRGRDDLYGVPFFNYGMLPQTWEDPDDKDGQGHGGDNDPLDIIELGTKSMPMGAVRAVRVIGSVALVDQGEIDHKILAIALDDPNAAMIHTTKDLDRVRPGVMNALLDWLRNYKIPEGKAANTFANESSPEDVTKFNRPAVVDAVLDFLHISTTSEATVATTLAKEALTSPEDAMKIIQHTHDRWKQLHAGKVEDSEDFWLGSAP